MKLITRETVFVMKTRKGCNLTEEFDALAEENLVANVNKKQKGENSVKKKSKRAEESKKNKSVSPAAPRHESKAVKETAQRKQNKNFKDISDNK